MASNPAPRARKNGRRTQAERTALSDKRMFEAAIRLIIEGGTQKTTLKAMTNEVRSLAAEKSCRSCVRATRPRSHHRMRASRSSDGSAVATCSWIAVATGGEVI